MEEAKDLRTPSEKAEAVFAEWVEQMRRSRVLVRAIADGEKVDLTLYAFRGKAVRGPDVHSRAE